CTHDPSAQVSAPTVSTRPDAVGERPRSRDSNSGSSISAPRNAATVSPCTAITAGNPGRASVVPAGNNLGAPIRTATNAITPTTARAVPLSWPATFNPTAPAAAPVAQAILARPAECPRGRGV